MTQKGFRQKLADRQEAIKSLVCVGLDPLPEKLPACLKRKFWIFQKWKAVAQWLIDIVDATAPHASLFKPQVAHYEAFPDGRKILQSVVNYIHEFYPEIPVFLDCKRGDIGRTQERYRIAHFEIDGVDGMNFSPYMGKECMEFLVDLKFLGRAIVGLCYTSNPSAREVQDVILRQTGKSYWEFIAESTMKWAMDLGILENAGLVMAAAYESPKGSGKVYSEHLKRCREITGGKMWYLIPGVGKQQGYVRETVLASYDGPGSIAINSSSEIIFASAKEDYAPAAANVAQRMQEDINFALTEM
jgi:orotidine-5'-phosphate decarboxylase